MKNFKIGDKIKITGILDFYYDKDNMRKFEIKPCNKVGYYVGYTFRQTGKVIPERNYSLDADEYDPAYLIPDNTFMVARIRFHERGKEYYTLFEDIQTSNDMVAEIIQKAEKKSHE